MKIKGSRVLNFSGFKELETSGPNIRYRIYSYPLPHRFHNFMPSRPMGSSLGFQCPFRWVFNVLFAEF